MEGGIGDALFFVSEMVQAGQGTGKTDEGFRDLPDSGLVFSRFR